MAVRSLLFPIIAAPLLLGSPSTLAQEQPAAERLLETTRSAIYSFSTLPANLRVAVILYQFDDTGPDDTGSNPHVLRLPVTGAYMTATLGADGLFTQKQFSSGWDTNWTSITGVSNGGVVFYKASNGTLLTAKLDGTGTLTNFRTLLATATGYTHLATGRENGLLFHNRATGAVRTASIDDLGNLAWKAPSASWAANQYTQVLGGLNGAFYLYNATTGFSYAVIMDVNYALTWVGAVSGIAPGQLLARAGDI
jgi:hypothetical protein